MKLDVRQLQWTRKPADYSISDDRIEILTSPHTDLWQRTYYHFRNDNAPVLQMETDEEFSPSQCRPILTASADSISAAL